MDYWKEYIVACAKGEGGFAKYCNVTWVVYNSSSAILVLSHCPNTFALVAPCMVPALTIILARSSTVLQLLARRFYSDAHVFAQVRPLFPLRSSMSAQTMTIFLTKPRSGPRTTTSEWLMAYIPSFIAFQSP
jgi:hypothetical protein